MKWVGDATGAKFVGHGLLPGVRQVTTKARDSSPQVAFSPLLFLGLNWVEVDPPPGFLGLLLPGGPPMLDGIVEWSPPAQEVLFSFSLSPCFGS